jgi:hypothetical protein
MLSFIHQMFDYSGQDDFDTDSSSCDSEDETTHPDTPTSPLSPIIADPNNCETLPNYGYRAIMQLAEARCQVTKLQELYDEQQQLNSKLQVSDDNASSLAVKSEIMSA